MVTKRTALHLELVIDETGEPFAYDFTAQDGEGYISWTVEQAARLLSLYRELRSNTARGDAGLKVTWLQNG